MAKKREEEEGGAPGWMVTFGDMMSLLLTFFVMLTSFAYFDERRFIEVSGSLKKALGVLPGWKGPVQPVKRQQGSGRVEESLKNTLEPLNLRRMLETIGLGKEIKVRKVEGGIAVSIPSAVLFERGKAVLKEGAKDVLHKVALLLKEFKGCTIRVEGHTDNIPIRGGRYSSNWELSAARASSVVEFFQEDGIDPKSLLAVGYGETKPIASNATEEGRAKNRRVEVIIVPPKKKEFSLFENMPLLKAISEGGNK